MREDGGIDRWLPLGGVGFLVLGLLGSLIIGDTPDFVDEPEVIAAYYTEDSDSVITGNVLYLFSGAFLLAFVAGLRGALGRLTGAGSGIAGVVLAGGIAGTALMLASAGADLSGGLRVDDRGAIDPSTATAMWDLSSTLFGTGAAIGWGVAALGLAAVALRRRQLPLWLGVLSLIYGLILLIVPIAWAAMVTLGIWTGAVGLYLYLRPPAAGTGNVAL